MMAKFLKMMLAVLLLLVIAQEISTCNSNSESTPEQCSCPGRGKRAVGPLLGAIDKQDEIETADEPTSLKETILKRFRRAPKKLQYSHDCKRQKLVNYAKSCGLTICNNKHIKVYDCRNGGKTFVTNIPHTVKENPTCESIINTLNGVICT